MARSRLLRLFFGTLRRRLITSVAVVHAVLMTLFIVDISLRQTALLVERQTGHAVALANSLAISSAGWLTSLDVSGLQELVDAQSQYPELKYSMLLNQRGDVLAHTDRRYRQKVVLDLPDDPTKTAITRSSDLIDVTVPVRLAGRLVGWSRVGVGQSDAREKVAGIALSGILYALVAILIGSIMAWFLGTHFTRRLSLIQTAMRRVRDGTAVEGVALAGTDEAADLADGFNQMIATLSERTRELKESEFKWQFAIEGAGDGLWDWSVETGEGYFSAQWKAILGYEDDEIGGKIEEWKERIHPDDQELCARAMEGHLRGETDTLQIEHRLRCKDGAYKWVLARGKAITRSEAGLPVRIIGTLSDVTERKEAEAEKIRLQHQLHQAQKMEAVGRLAGGVAHDFNNMLGVIIGHSELALNQTSPSAPIHDNLTAIRDAADRSADLTRQLLGFARKQTVAPRVLDLNESIQNMLKMLQRLIGEAVDLRWRPSGAQVWVKIDPTQLDQILANLCLNARDAITGVGKITIETGTRAFDEAYCAEHPDFRPGHYSLIAVTDDGSGMGKETLEKLFEPFFTTKEQGRGTGLGLATVYGIVRQNEGFINVYSEIGKGTTFKIYLPAHGPVPKSAETHAPSKDGLRGTETILLVEDEPSLMTLNARILEELGYRVIGASTPGEAITRLRDEPGEIDLLVTDVVMPEMNGRDLSHRLLAIHPRLKCLFMSGYTANVIAHHGVLSEGVNFLQKPFSRTDLAVKVRRILDQGPSAEPTPS